MRFRDRRDAGQQLASRLVELQLHAPLILALPRGGVPVADEIAKAFGAPLEVFVARKIGAPGQKELGIGAIAEGGEVVATDALLRMLGVTDQRFEELAELERPELERRIRQYRGDSVLPDLNGRDVVLVDDGVATGVTAEAALRSLRRGGARRIILAAPACAADSARRLSEKADEVVFLIVPARFNAVGEWYDDFSPTSDEEVMRILGRDSRTDHDEPA